MGDGPVDKDTLISNLDFGDPLYLHASDCSAMTIVTVKLKGTENYSVWKSAMRLALKGRNKFGFVDGTTVKNETDIALGNQWERCNTVVLTWILNSLSEELFLGHAFSENPRLVWQELFETYNKVDESMIFKLHQQISTTVQGGAPVSEYYHKLNQLWKQFDSMVSLTKCTCAAEKDQTEFNQRLKLLQFLMGLDEIYQPLRSTILSKEVKPTVKSAFAIISAEESHRDIASNVKSAAVFAAKANEVPKSVTNNNSATVCSHCNKQGHTVDKCFKLIGFPPNFKKRNFKNNKSNNSSSGGSGSNTTDKSSNGFQFSNDQITKLMALIGEKSQTTSDHSIHNMSGLSEKESDEW